MRRSGPQLLTHDAAAIAYTYERPWRWERPIEERRVIRPGGNPFVGLGYQSRVHILSKPASFITLEKHLRHWHFSHTPENQQS